MDSEAEFLQYEIVFADKSHDVISKDNNLEIDAHLQNSEYSYYDYQRQILANLDERLAQNSIIDESSRKAAQEILSENESLSQNDIIELIREASGRYFQTEQFGISQIQKNAPDIIVMAIIMRKFYFLLFSCQGLIKQLVQKFASQKREHKKKQNVRTTWKMLYAHLDKALLIQLTMISFNYNSYCSQITLINNLTCQLKNTSKVQLTLHDLTILIQELINLRILSLNILIQNTKQDLAIFQEIKCQTNLASTYSKIKDYEELVEKKLKEEILRLEYIRSLTIIDIQQGIKFTQKLELKYLNLENFSEYTTLFKNFQNRKIKKILGESMSNFIFQMESLKQSSDQLLRKVTENIKKNGLNLDQKNDKIQSDLYQMKLNSPCLSFQNSKSQFEQKSQQLNDQMVPPDLNNFLELQQDEEQWYQPVSPLYEDQFDVQDMYPQFSDYEKPMNDQHKEQNIQNSKIIKIQKGSKKIQHTRQKD